MAATDNLQALFGGTRLPEEMQRDLITQRAQEFAKLSTTQQLGQMGYEAGASLGGGLAQAMGVDITDPQIKRMSQLQALSQGAESTPEGLKALAMKLQANGFAAEAAMAMDKAREISLTEAKTTALVEEPINARADKMTMARERNEAAIEAAKVKAEAAIEKAKQDGATKKEIEEMRIESRKDLAKLVASLKGDKPAKPLVPALQKEEDKDLAAIDSFSAQRDALANPIAALTVDPATGKRLLELGPLKNTKYAAQLATGKSTPEARAYEQLKSAVDTAVNLQVSAEKGVQTDADVLRFAKALIASYGQNDTEATLAALKRFQGSITKAEEKTKGRLESRRKSQGVESYYGTPFKGDSGGTTPPATPNKTVKWGDM